MSCGAQLLFYHPQYRAACSCHQRGSNVRSNSCRLSHAAVVFYTRDFLMTDFAETAMRHRCRNPKCRAKLKTPVSNSREAFCPETTCKQRFYRLRCYVCEEKKPGRLDAHTCGRRKCKNAMRMLRMPKSASRVEIGSRNPIESGLPERSKSGRGWHIVAGVISPNALHCATVPDGPDSQWKDGGFERIEGANRAALKAHFAELAKDCLVQRQHMPPNLIGGYQPKYRPLKLGPEKSLQEIKDRVASGIPFNDPDAEQWRLPDPAVPGIGYDATTVNKQTVAAPHHVSDDLSIPAFLRR
jgi:hypothetical protein